MPQPVAKPNKDEARVPMGGFVFTFNGLFPDLDESMSDELSLPTFTPQPANEVVYEDGMDESTEFI
jgi:hypothetical protein